jgi:hypothetical protein
LTFLLVYVEVCGGLEAAEYLFNSGLIMYFGLRRGSLAGLMGGMEIDLARLGDVLIRAQRLRVMNSGRLLA